MDERKGSFFGKLGERLTDVIMARGKVDEELFSRLEEILITSDIGMDTVFKMIEDLKKTVKIEVLENRENIKNRLKDIMIKVVDKKEESALSEERPLIILVVGVNGSGKTTTVGKLGNLLKSQGDSVLFVAADTFRAAAIKQLVIWGDRAGITTIHHKEGADPSAVIYDGIQAAKSRGISVVVADTAGRLHTKKNLMMELEKISRVVASNYPEAKTEVLLVLDGTTGKNAVSQAKEFSEVTDISGIVLTKLDGTAKGGIVFTICEELGLPVKYIGTGEGMDDIEVFSAEDFVGGIFD